MNHVPTNRYFVFISIALVGFVWDVGSKNLVFSDLGYVLEPGTPRQRVFSGKNRLFQRQTHSLKPGVSRSYLKRWVSFKFHTSFNHGALWGFGQGWTWVFATLSFLAIIAVVGWLFVWKAAKSLWLTVSLAFIMAGTLGNLWDRLSWHGYRDVLNEPVHAVRDFLYFKLGSFDWPVFNFADVFLVTGAIMLIVQAIYLDAKHPPTTNAKSKNETGPAESVLDISEIPDT